MHFPSGNGRLGLRLSANVMLLGAFAFTQIAVAGSKSSAPAKSAPAPKAAPAAKPSGGGGGHPGGSAPAHAGTTMGHPGSTTMRSGPSANSPMTHSGPSANSPMMRNGPAAGGFHGPGAGPTGVGGGPAARTATGGHMPTGGHTLNTGHGAVTRRPNGRISDIHDTRRGMDVHHGLNGSRRVSVERPDHSRVFAERGRRGYIERPYAFHGHDYARRSYYWHGHEYHRFYRGYYYHGAFIHVYAPGFYFAPAFYGWAYNPWRAPVVYGWGWAGSPWYGHYGYYFAPAPVYATPAEWLTDYAISTDLQAAYTAQQEGHTEAMDGSAPVGQPLLSPAVKAQVANEVRSQIALENSEAQMAAQGQEPDPDSSSINRTFADGQQHVFVANSALDVVDSAGNECPISDGDVVRTISPPGADSSEASVIVLASKGGRECQASSTVTVAVSDLQEMQNGLRENIDQGMQELQSNQGKKGLPLAPNSAMAPPVQTAFSQAAPPAEADGSGEIDRQMASADQADQEASNAAPAGFDGSPVAPPAATVNIAVGQTIDQVTAAMGPPKTLVNLGVKKIFKYPDLTVVFVNGKVADVK